MRVQITARHCEIPDALRERMEQLLEKLDRYEPRLSAAEIVFDEERHLRKVEGILSIDRDQPIVAHGEADDFTGAVDQLMDRLSRAVRRRRDRVTEHRARPVAEGLETE